ncbi:hypothetical protein QVG61_02185 [Thiohalobacter sp. IOR34]|uniref:hypothetical protein n=1 Tax=Thiohalobacter sp. IOR34 TaxID=3057176 RepID=UPI0025AF8160|nr:hypothetical protein [Thiohalobacter sp. IOR34]WJW75921.1 hypothetical protein QVG61_02185 [Thiohalobacter sp. IOR34]
MHILCCITPHGFGHAAQTAVVVNALRQRVPGLRLSLQTTVPEWFLASRIEGPFELHPEATDFGLLMDSALDIDLEASARAYARQHAEWSQRLAAQVDFLRRLEPDLVLANVPCLPLLAARQAGCPAVALCSLNWLGIYRHYFAGRPEAPAVLAQMRTAYQSADVFLAPEPAMPMPELDGVRPIGPLARLGRRRREAIDARFGLAPDARLVLVALGGVGARLPVGRWPRQPDVHYLVPAAWGVAHPQAIPLESLEMDFSDLLASADALLGKCGYGTVAECACNATPLLYIPRPEWPEEPWLLDWLRRHGNAEPVAREQLEAGGPAEALTRLWAQPRSRPPRPDGAGQAVAQLMALLGMGGGQ